MELKHQFLNTTICHYESFNRTIVELKLLVGLGALVVRNSFNRTIVELKQRILYENAKETAAQAFNRTIVELKPISLNALLITPIHF